MYSVILHSCKAAALAALLLFAVTVASPGQAQVSFERARLKIDTQTGPVYLDVEIADTDDKMAQGLMFRRELKPDRGMMFLHQSEQEITMWMKNTYIPLDMIFIRDNWRVSHIARDTEPLSTEIVSSQGPASRVLEIGGGQAAKLGIKPGDLVTLQR